MTTTIPTAPADLATVAELAGQLRVDSIRSSTSAGSGHPTSSMSAADRTASGAVQNRTTCSTSQP
jgi:transketolase